MGGRGGGRGRCSPPGAVRGVPVPTLQSAGWPRGPGVNGLLPAGLRAGVPGRLGSDSIINPATQDHESPLSHPGGVRPGAQGDRETWIQPPHAPCPARRVRLGVRWTPVPAGGCALDPGARGGAASAAESRVPPEEVLTDAGGAALWRAFLRRSQANWSTDDSFQNSFCKACLPRAWAFQVLSVLFLCT